MDEIAKRLAETIKLSKLSYAEIEKRTGVARSSIQRYATGHTNKIPVDRLIKIVEICNGSLEYVLCLDTKDWRKGEGK